MAMFSTIRAAAESAVIVYSLIVLLEILHYAHGVFLRVFYESYSKQRLFSCSVIWLVDSVFTLL